MAQGRAAKVPRQSLIYLLVCILGIAAFLAVGVIPSRNGLIVLDQEIAVLKLRMERQKILSPLFTTLKDRVQKSGNASGAAAAKKGLSPDQIDKVPILLGDVASRCGLQVLAVTPDAKSISADPNLLLVYATLKGKLPDLRKLLLELVDLPYVDHLEQLRIYEAQNGKEYGLKVWLLVSGQG